MNLGVVGVHGPRSSNHRPSLVPLLPHSDGVLVVKLSALGGLTFERVIADRGYAWRSVLDVVLERDAEVVIPPHQRANSHATSTGGGTENGTW